MAEMTKTVLEKTIKHYIRFKDYQSAKNYIENFADKIKGFNKEEALKQVSDAEKGIQPPIKAEVKEDKEE
jgi:hypothetical protein